MANEPEANKNQNTPTSSDLDRQVALDAKAHEAAKLNDQESEEINENENETEEAEPEVIEESSEEEKTEEPENKEEKEVKDVDEDHNKRIAKLAFERREAQKQLRIAQEELARLKGEKPPPSRDEEFERRVEEAATRKAKADQFYQRTISIRKAGNDTFPDFERTLSRFSDVSPGGIAANVTEALLEVENPEKIIDYLGKNLDQYEDILNMTPAKMGVVLGKLASKVNAPPPPKPQSKAPAPIRPVTGSSKSEPNVEKMSMAEFIKLEDEKQRKRWH